MATSARIRARLALPLAALLAATGVSLVAAPAIADTGVTDWTGLSAAAADPGTTVIDLDADITAPTQNLQIPALSTLTLDLDGQDLSLRQLTLGAGSTFTITDTSTGEPGELTVIGYAYNEGGIRTTGAGLVITGQAVVDATAGARVAGIGGADGTNNGSVTISGAAMVTATGGSGAAGIGGGYLGGGGMTTIQDAAVVVATGGDDGAGIGGGYQLGGGQVTIMGAADVTASGGSGAAGIGGGASAGGGSVQIRDDATVEATGGPGGAGIGGNGLAGAGNIDIVDDAIVEAIGGSGATVGLGSGWGFVGYFLVSGDAQLTATGGSTGFGIGLGTAVSVGNLQILGDSVVTAAGGLGSLGSSDDRFGTVKLDGELRIPSGRTLTVPGYLDAITGSGSITGAGIVVNNGSIALPDANVTATVNGRNYDVALVLAGGTVTPSVTTIRVLAATMFLGDREFPVASRNGFVHTGWKAGTAAFDEQTVLTGDVIVTAQWSGYPATVPVPTISGTTKVGQTLSADPKPGQWAVGTVFTYSWLRDGKAIAGTNSEDYTITGADFGTQLSVTVTGTNPAQPTVAKTSAKTAKIAVGTMTGNTAYISGLHQVGHTLSSNAASTTPGAKFAYQWYIDGVAVAKATTRDWLVPAAANGKLVSVRVTASSTGYTSEPMVALTNATIASGQFVLPPTPTISGTPQTGQKLTAVPGTWTPKATLSYQWFRDGTPVPGATASTYTPPANSVGATWTVRVTGSATGYTSTFVTSSPSAATLASFTAATPKITGKTKVGSILTAVPGVWTPMPPLTFEWLRVSGSTTTVIPGAVNPTYQLTAADKGKTIRVRITGTQSGYGTLVKTSAATAKVG